MNIRCLATKTMKVLSIIFLILSAIVIIFYGIKQVENDKHYEKALEHNKEFATYFIEHKDYSMQISIGFGGVGVALMMLLICEISENVIEIGKGIQWYNNAYYQEQMQKYQQSMQYQAPAPYQTMGQTPAPATYQPGAQVQAGEQQPSATQEQT